MIGGVPLSPHPDLLPIGGDSAEEIHQGEELTTLNTQFFAARINKGINPSTGKPTSQFGVTSRIAFEGVLICENACGEPCFVLMSKTRPEGSVAGWRGAKITKFPGGYFTQTASEGTWGFVQDRLKALTGATVDVDSGQVIGQVVGHTELELPVIFVMFKTWELTGEPAMDLCLVTLQEVQRLARASMLHAPLSGYDPADGKPWCLENDTGVEIALALALMFRNGELNDLQPIPEALLHLVA